MRAVAVDLDGVLGDTKPLWRDWLTDLARRAHLDGAVPEDVAEARLDHLEGNWRTLLERFAEEHAPVYLRPSAEATAALRRLQADGVRIGAFTDAPEPLARVAAAHLGAARRLEALEAGPGSLERLLERLGADAQVVRTPEELSALST
jgi:phosphoglycolate phosphatase-like HAD superfamily hydrolase